MNIKNINKYFKYNFILYNVNKFDDIFNIWLKIHKCYRV